MLAYRHAFHAGNHADVLKHIVLLQLLRHMHQKDKGLRLVDTHAGAGLYALDSPQAMKKGEYLQGICRLAARDNLPLAVADYLQCVRDLNTGSTLQQYPGSPLLAHALLRPQDQLRLFELHPTDHQALVALLGAAQGVEIRQADGFAALKSQLPPPTRRALVLIDPSYEGQGDYTRVLDAMGEALRRFAEGVYMVWYPLVSKPGAAAMVQGLKALAQPTPQSSATASARKGWLHAQLSVQEPDAQGFGLCGSGLMIINPPHTLHAQLQVVLPWLAQTLAQHSGASHRLEQSAS